jgi:transaldolase
MHESGGMDDRIREVIRIGQSLWLDNLHRGLLDERRLERWIHAGLSGVTSNPTILEHAMRKHPGYRQDVGSLAQRGDAPSEIYDAIVRQEIQRAADLLRPTWLARRQRDGFVSLEVAPALADDAARTVAEAERLRALVARPNLLIKVPATAAGCEAIATLTERGVAVNVTLIFSRRQYLAVADAFQRGLEARARRGAPLEVVSYASFFVSRIDTAIDRRLPEGSPLRGRIAIANARLAYQSWRELTDASRWRALEARGARPQRLLWGSTGTKNPAYSDVRYVEELIGPETVNTMPDATLEAFLDHGQVRPSLEEGIAEARAYLAELAAQGIDLDEVCEQLQRDGLRAFAESLDSLMRWIAEEAGRAAAPQPPP